MLSEGDLCTILQTDFGEFPFHALCCIRARGRAGAAMRPGPSCEICALSLAPPELSYALPPERYLGAICGLRIRRRERSLVDAAHHQVLERSVLPGIEEVDMHGGVITRVIFRGKLRLAPCSW